MRVLLSQAHAADSSTRAASIRANPAGRGPFSRTNPATRAAAARAAAAQSASPTSKVSLFNLSPPLPCRAFHDLSYLDAQRYLKSNSERIPHQHIATQHGPCSLCYLVRSPYLRTTSISCTSEPRSSSFYFFWILYSGCDPRVSEVHSLSDRSGHEASSMQHGIHQHHLETSNCDLQYLCSISSVLSILFYSILSYLSFFTYCTVMRTEKFFIYHLSHKS